MTNLDTNNDDCFLQIIMCILAIWKLIEILIFVYWQLAKYLIKWFI